MKKLLLFTIILFVGMIMFAQEQNTLLLEEFGSLRKELRNKELKPEQRKKRATAYLEKVKKSNRNELIGRGFYLLASNNPNIEEKLQYLDSTIFYTKDIKGDDVFPVQAYMNKGATLYNQKDLKGTIDNFIKAEGAAERNGDIEFQFDIKYNIGFLKRHIGDYKEAEALLLECKAYEENIKKKYSLSYISILYQLSSIYFEMGRIEEGKAINEEGIYWSKKKKNDPMYYSFVMNEGINLNKKGDYGASLDSLQKALPHVLPENVSFMNYYLGTTYYKLDQKEKGLLYFKKNDSILNATNDLYPSLIPAYEYLISDSKKRKDQQAQLYYTNQLLKIDSITDKDYGYVLKTIVKQYDIPKYVAEREKIIINLRNQNEAIANNARWMITLSLLVCALAFIGLLYYYRLKKDYKKKYEALINNSTSVIEEQIEIKEAKMQPVSMEIDDKIVQNILEKLHQFEQEETYLTNQISLKDVAKIVDTNSKYLSKIINSHRNKNFASYINDLRIDYFVRQIQKDSTYRKYTIRAIAEDIGFSNPEGFSRAFQKKTGLKPSYFIRKIIEDEKNK
ncbi:helix-turn-helix domain-containing protein [Kordia sp.]|uniref:helix-turn-helix domain-containing protein n=1 Tax=Kordia sp. TaxID=1965332 RepID=UPI003D2ACBEA